MRAFDELRPLAAGRILTLWRISREEAQDPLERALLCNAAILAECCLSCGEPVYESALDVLGDLTGREMEALLARLADGGGEVEPEPATPMEVNPSFDAAQFEARKKE